MASRPFADFLREHRNGITHDELSELLNEVVAAVSEQNKAGSLTITISMKPAGNSGAYELKVDAKAKLPKGEPGVSIFFVSPENNLIREDPRQSRLELREVRQMPTVNRDAV